MTEQTVQQTAEQTERPRLAFAPRQRHAGIGAHGGQEVPHLHVHIFGGQPLGPMIMRR